MAEIVATVFAEDVAGTRAEIRRAAMLGASWVELRLDGWPIEGDVAPLLEDARVPVMATCRLPRDGGRYDGSLEARRRLLQRAVDQGARGVDVEDWEEWWPDPRPALVVRSHHDFRAVPPDLAALRDDLLERGGDVAKLVVTAPDLADAAPVLDLLGATDQETHPTVAFAHGRAAWPTRVLAAALGAPLVYGCVEGDPADVGQPPVDLLHGVLAVGELSRRTQLFGLLGNPARHSLGLWLHNRAFRDLGTAAVYLPFETSRPETVIGMLPRRRLRGLSVTAPFKEAMARLCHRLEDDAAETGVVNTMVLEAHGQVVGHNTDVAGVLAALAGAGLTAPAAPTAACVLGSGGGARAAVVALRRLGFEVTVLARTLEPIRDFARRLGIGLASLRGAVLDDLAPQVVVHATPVGSLALAEGDGRTAPAARLLPEWTPAAGTFVLDMVYRPAETELLRAAQAAGAVPVSGLGMFLNQAAEQVRLFTGRELPPDRLRSYLAGAL